MSMFKASLHWINFPNTFFRTRIRKIDDLSLFLLNLFLWFLLLRLVFSYLTRFIRSYVKWSSSWSVFLFFPILNSSIWSSWLLLFIGISCWSSGLFWECPWCFTVFVLRAFSWLCSIISCSSHKLLVKILWCFISKSFENVVFWFFC